MRTPGSLQVNFRGSTGFGKGFLHAGDKEWGVGKMQVLPTLVTCASLSRVLCMDPTHQVSDQGPGPGIHDQTHS